MAAEQGLPSARSESTLLPRVMLRAVGSLWFAAVLLVLLSVAMACATVFESAHGTDQALEIFYKAWWFELGMGLLALNVLAAVVVRYPFSKRHIGFVCTHSGILIVLLGALVTKYVGVDGRVGIAEGQSVDSFTVPQPTLSLTNNASRARSAVDLAAPVFGGFKTVEPLNARVLTLGDVRVEVERYIPDSTVTEEVINDDRHGKPAVEVSLSPSGRDNPTWLFADRDVTLGMLSTTFRVVDNPAEWERLLAAPPQGQDESQSTVKVECDGESFDIPLDKCMNNAVPLGDTGRTIRVLSYLPHATVGPNGGLVSAPNRPFNPAIEVELTGAEGSEKRFAFAHFPDFTSMHGGGDMKGVKVTFVASASSVPEAPIEVLGGPDGGLHVRFRPEGGEVTSREVSVGTAIESPWPGRKFTVLQHLGRARFVRKIVPVDPVRETRTPAVLLAVSTAADTSKMWVQKYWTRPVTIDGTSYDLVFGDKEIPLGFQMTLDSFRIGYYPGEGMPRSYESQVTIVDGASGRRQSRVISMNNPTSYGGYDFYQSSYRMDQSRSISFLSVARDPGLPVVFAGYFVVMGGMIVVLITRMLEHRGASRAPSTAEAGAGTGAGRVGMADMSPPRHGERVGRRSGEAAPTPR